MSLRLALRNFRRFYNSPLFAASVFNRKCAFR